MTRNRIIQRIKRVKFTLLRCATAEFFFFCCDSVAAPRATTWAPRSSTCDAQRAAPRTTAWAPRPSTCSCLNGLYPPCATGWVCALLQSRSILTQNHWHLLFGDRIAQTVRAKYCSSEAYIPNTRCGLPGLNGDPSLNDILYTAGGFGELYLRRLKLLVLSLRCAGHCPVKIRDERERVVTTWPVMTKSRGPNWGSKQLPGERPRETAET